MQLIPINCPHCNHSMEYWTIENYINCPKCKGHIAVEPCVEELTEDELDENPIEE